MHKEPLQERVSRTLFTQEAIQSRTQALGRAISEDYRPGGRARKDSHRPPMAVCVLHGALVFMADLLRQIDIEIEYDFICATSYGNGTSPGAVRLIKDLERPIRGRDVLIVEDIIDTGHTIQYLKRTLAARDPASLRICTLLNKTARREIPVEIEYMGFVLDKDEFIVGYGMDYAGLYRNMPDIAVLKPEFIQ
jgi:hypoxanthine phosphoribosyltransferase